MKSITWVFLLFPFFAWSQATRFDREGKMHENQIMVVVFLGLDCPISQKYVSRLNQLYRDFRTEKRIVWRFLVPGSAPLKAIRNFSKTYNTAFLLKADSDFDLALQLGATVTPEVFISVNDSVMYRGAIDNWFYELGRYRLEVTEHYLRDALAAILRNGSPAVLRTEAIGCLIQLPDKRSKHTHDHRHE